MNKIEEKNNVKFLNRWLWNWDYTLLLAENKQYVLYNKRSKKYIQYFKKNKDINKLNILDLIIKAEKIEKISKINMTLLQRYGYSLKIEENWFILTNEQNKKELFLEKYSEIKNDHEANLLIEECENTIKKY